MMESKYTPSGEIKTIGGVGTAETLTNAILKKIRFFGLLFPMAA
jgi:hypothetical protein